MSDYNTDELRRMKNLNNAIKEMDGIKVPYNLILSSLEPLRAWLLSEGV